MNWFLIILAIVGFFLTFAVAVYLVALYCSEEDSNQAWLPKIIVVVGLALSAFTVLLLPFDVANRRDPETMNGSTGGIDLATMWQMVLWTIAAWVLFVTPFATFYYEAWDPNQKTACAQIRPALGYTLVTAFVFFLLFVILWLTVGYADLDYQGHSSPAVNWNLNKAAGESFPFNLNWDTANCFCSKDPTGCFSSNYAKITDSTKSVCFEKSGTLSIKVSAFIYIVGLLTAIGWLSFIVFGGVGLIALPMDLINDWRMRPEKLTRMEYESRKKILATEVQDLLASGKKLEEKQAAGEKGFFGSTKKSINKFKARVNTLEKKWERLNDSMDVDRQVILSIIKLPLGILGIVISILWILHILIYNLSNANPFLNNMFGGLDSFFPLFGTLSYAIFALWMLWAAVKGCFKVGCNFGIIQIHPMKVNGTLMSSFLFNTLLVLLTSVTVSQFCSLSFRAYAANTVVDSLFSTYVNNLRGIGYVMRYFQIALLVFSFLAFLYFLIKPWCCKGKKGYDSDDE